MHAHEVTRTRLQTVEGVERILRHPACPLVGAAAVAGLAFVLVSARVLPLLGGIVATLVIGCVGPWIAVRGATMTITWDRRRARVGDTLTATLTRGSLLPWWRPQVAVRWPAGEQDATVNDAAAAADGRAERVAVVPHRRGRFPRSAPALETSQPLGVVTARRAIPLPEPVIVWPASAVVRMPAGLVAAAGTGRETSERITGHSGDPIGARDYRAGDSMRSIHWPIRRGATRSSCGNGPAPRRPSRGLSWTIVSKAATAKPVHTIARSMYSWPPPLRSSNRGCRGV